MLVGGTGAVLHGDDDREYLDFAAGHFHCTVGHGRFELADQVASALAVLEGVSADVFSTPTVERFAALVAAATPVDDGRVLPTTSGAEAFDIAVELARVVHAVRGDRSRVGVMGGVGPDELADAAARLALEGAGIAAVVADPVDVVGGVHPYPPGHLAALRELCDAHGALLVVDEVVTGFGRLGAWSACARDGVAPDLLVLGETLTSGYLPLGAVVVAGAALDALESAPDLVLRRGSTLPGLNAAAAAVLETVRILIEDDLLAAATAVGERIGAGLAERVGAGALAAARGVGALWACDLPDGRSAGVVRTALLRDGVIVRATGPSTLVACPPLVVSTGQVDEFLGALDRALAAVDGGSAGRSGTEGVPA